MNNVYPRSFSHIGLSVPDLDAAVKFYTEVMGWYTIMEPTEIVEDDSPIGEMCTEVFGSGWGSFRIAHLSTGDRIGVEIFEFKIKKTLKTTLNTGKQVSFTSAFKIQMLKSWLSASLQQAVKSVWKNHAIITLVKNLTA
nr:VOC family protein [Psychrobacter sp. JCM 18903]